ncbi:MAG: NAD(P)-dependent oxidoreductase [Planctomycetes bacterium]|nr:NAD(P)-dependent oxidoreductase [Planctomycetota bacterium]
MPDKKTLVIGSAGRVGTAAVQELHRCGIPVRGFDLAPTRDISDFVVGSIGEPSALRAAMTDVGTVIHLAATPDDEDDFFAGILPNNIVGVYHVLEAARAAGVRRLVLASSGQVNWWQRETGPLPIKADDPPSPRYWYAATKMFLESIGRGFAEQHGMEVIVVRLGWCPRTKEQVEEIAVTDWAQDVYLSPGDAGRFFACAVTAPPLKFAIVYAMSNYLHKCYHDLGPAKTLLGYAPQEHWPQGVEVVLGKPWTGAK